jgi:hypothetical protein
MFRAIDDLFDDEEDDKKTVPKKGTKEPVPSTRKYLDKDWKLNPGDEKDFKTLKAGGKSVEPAEKLPMFALMYKFRKEYFDFGAEGVMADHQGHCAKYTRIASTQFINIAKARGAVILWLGESESDKDATRSEVMTFLEEDPLIEKDIVESWDLIDLTAKGASADLPATASAGK